MELVILMVGESGVWSPPFPILPVIFKLLKQTPPYFTEAWMYDIVPYNNLKQYFWSVSLYFWPSV
jgi:hypothetical protein